MHPYRTHTCAQLSSANVGETVRLSGWIHRKRDHGNLLFVDLRGTMGPAKVRGTDGKLEVSRLYRVQNEGPGCDDPNFKLLTFAANGNEPFWSARVNNQGLRLDRPEHETLALPYVAEELPNGSTSYSSEANGKKVELWIAPSSCTDSMSGAFSSYSAELRIDGETLRGCAYPGALGK